MIPQRWTTAASVRHSCATCYRFLLNVIAAVSLLNRNSIELPLVAIIPCSAFKKIFLLQFYQWGFILKTLTFKWEVSSKRSVICYECLFLKTMIWNWLVIEQLWYSYLYFAVNAHINEPQNTDTSIEWIWLCGQL